MTPPLLVTSDWARLMRGQTIGKRVVFANNAFRSGVDIFTLNGQDKLALPLKITLVCPRIVINAPNPGDGNFQNVTGEQDNEQTLNPTVQNVNWSALRGVLEWGIGGLHADADVDFVNGSKVQIEASYVRLKAGIDGNFSAIGGQNNNHYVLGAFIGPSGGGDSNAQRTIQCGTVQDGASTGVFSVPKFAKRFALTGQSWNNNTQIDVQFWRNPSPLNLQARFSVNANLAIPNQPTLIPGEFYAIPNGSWFFNLTSVDQELTNASMIFELSI